MKHLALFLAALVGAACDTNITVDPEGYACGPSDPCPAGYACTSGKCHALGGVSDGGSLCATVTCDAPPATACATGTVLRTWTGRCDATTGLCAYDPVDTTCASACTNGACADKCAGVTCVTPPPDTCATPTTLHTWSQTGTCAAATGQCTYTGTDKACANGCDAATTTCRNQNLCAGTTCTTPPPASCQGSTLRVPATTGTCTPGTGACNYPSTDTACPNGCANGACVPAALTFSQVGPRLDFPVTAVDVAPGSAGGEVLAVGPSGRVARWNGTAWSKVTAPGGSTAALNAVNFVNGTVAYVVGRNRAVWKYQGGTLALVPNPPFGGGANVVAVHGRSEGHALFSDDSGGWGRLTGGAWTSGNFGNGYALRSAYLDEQGHERLAGLCPGATTSAPPRACVMHRLPPATTFTAEKHASDTTGFTAVGGTFDPPTALSTDALVGFATPDLARASNGFFSAFTVSPALEGSDVLGITAIASATAARAGLYVLTSSVNVNGGGHLYRLTRTPNSSGGAVNAAVLLDTFFGQESLSPNDSIGVIVAEAKVLSATQGVNNIFRRGFVPDEALDLGEDWNAVTTDAAGDLVLLSNFGDLALKTPTSPTFEFHRGPYLVVQAAEARGGTGVLVAGQDNNGDGALERYSSSGGVPTFAPVSVTAPGITFQGVCRVSDAEGWAVGTRGTLAAINGLSASLATSGTQKDLLAVSCPAPGVAVACGQDGTVLRLSGGAWSPITPAFPVARVITSCAQIGQAVYAAGDGFFYRLDAGASAWTSLPSRAGLDNLVVRALNDVYASSQAAASNTSDVVRFDGTKWTTMTTVSASLRGGMQVGAKVVYGGSSGALVEGR